MVDPLGREEIQRALAEDRARDDVTTTLLGPVADLPAIGRFRAEERFVVAGVPVVRQVFLELEPAATLHSSTADGSWIEAGDVIATVGGSTRTLLAGERVALNFLQRLSGVATLTRKAVDAVAGTGAAITHTRKTTPGLRALERYAVRAGGGVDNRGSLADAVLWKDNHWSLLKTGRARLRDALATAPAGLAIAVEIESESQLEEALAAGVTHILIDNQAPAQLAAWARRAGPSVTIQASGGITPENAAAYARAGARLISIGALTHSAPAAPISCEISLSD